MSVSEKHFKTRVVLILIQSLNEVLAKFVQYHFYLY